MAITKVSRSLLNTGVSDSSDATAITIDSSERVGIGLTSPASPLHVRVASDANFEVENASGVVRLAALNDARSVNINMEFTSTHFGFLTGNLGVGTTTINTGTLGTANKFLEVAAGTANGSGTIILSRTTNGNNNEIGGLRFANTDNADDDGLDSDGKLVAAISARSVTSDSNASDDSGANLLFYTKPEAGNYAERMRIDSTGAMLVGTASQITTSVEECIHIKNGDGAGQLFLDNTRSSGSQYMVQIHRLGTRVGSIQTTTTGTSYLETSDYRLKENVDYDFNALERVAQLKPARFNFIIEPDVTVDGFLAHEVSDIVPEAVSGEKDAVKEEEYEITPAEFNDYGDIVTEAVMGTREVPDLQGIDHSKLVPLLTKAIQELSAKVEELQSEINTLKGE